MIYTEIRIPNVRKEKRKGKERERKRGKSTELGKIGLCRTLPIVATKHTKTTIDP